MYELSMMSTDGVHIGELWSKQVQTDLNERVNSKWSKQEVAVQSVAR